MEEPDLNNYLAKEDLFSLFRTQLKKDFEGAGANADFADTLPCHLEELKQVIIQRLQTIQRSNSALISSLLYRIDISERQLQKHQKLNPALSFDETVAELMIKRVLQKVILKRKFSG